MEFIFLGDCSGRNFDVAILGQLETLRNAVNALVNELGVSPKGNHFGMIPP